MYFPKIDPDKCKNHGDCFRICPEDVFDMDDENRVAVARPGDCTKCDSCVIVCPEEAITVDELSSKISLLSSRLVRDNSARPFP